MVFVTDYQIELIEFIIIYTNVPAGSTLNQFGK